MELREAAGSDRNQAERTYDVYAPVYDVFTAHYDYEGWLADLIVLLEGYGLDGRRLLDVGCGTGKSFLSLLPHGWQVTGCDISESMLERAREKTGAAARLCRADMRDLPRLGEFDLVWAIDDAVNYLLTERELEQALAGMRGNLADEGLLLFDVNTLHAYRTFFAETETIERDGHRLVWRGLSDPDVPPGSLCESRLEIDPDEPNGDGAECVHRQRHFPEAAVLPALERAGLGCVDVYGQGLDGIPRQPLDESVHTKALYIARRAR
jgi:SAM-dependent methyltransferase